MTWDTSAFSLLTAHPLLTVLADNAHVLTDGALALKLTSDDFDVQPENRVNGFSPTGRPRLRVIDGYLPDRTRENGFVYGESRRQILYYLRARYYDPSTAQFL
ncbi:MAG: hypothetical protein ABI352_00005, partial [Candidatus Dormibacter sp.]